MSKSVITKMPFCRHKKVSYNFFSFH